MLSIIVYCEDHQDTTRTIEEILLSTDNEHITEIIVINDVEEPYYNDHAIIINNQTKLGNLKSFNNASRLTKSDYLVFISKPCKLDDNWSQFTIDSLDETPRAIISPKLHGLDTNLWCSEPNFITKCSIRLDLSIKPVVDDGQDVSLVVLDNWFAIRRDWFWKLGMLDASMLEMCIRAWLCGGQVRVDKEIVVSSNYQMPCIDDLAASRLMHLWFGNLSEKVMNYRGRRQVDPGNISALALVVEHNQVRDIKWLLDVFAPELGKINGLYGRYPGSSIAVVADCPSFDYVNKFALRDYDVVIGVDYASGLIDADFAITLCRDIAKYLFMSGKYDQGSIVCPTVLTGHDSNSVAVASKVVPNAIQFELGDPNSLPTKLNSPFANFGHSVHSAIHFAAFLGARKVTLYGWDNGFVNGRSHTSKIEHYRDGFYIKQSPESEDRYKFYASGLSKLNTFLASMNIKLFRVGLYD